MGRRPTECARTVLHDRHGRGRAAAAAAALAARLPLEIVRVQVRPVRLHSQYEDHLIITPAEVAQLTPGQQPQHAMLRNCATQRRLRRCLRRASAKQTTTLLMTVVSSCTELPQLAARRARQGGVAGRAPLLLTWRARRIEAATFGPRPPPSSSFTSTTLRRPSPIGISR